MVGVLVFGVSSCVSTREKPLPVEGARAELWLAPLASCAEERALETRKLDRRTQVRVDEYTTVEYLLRELCAGDGTSCPYLLRGADGRGLRGRRACSGALERLTTVVVRLRSQQPQVTLPVECGVEPLL
jgi:hypothetical protein